ncbi:NACHT, LRR and PYD domains-containing protein 3-like [Alosa alosa]|uniref:NACHT, LRR and PYD domains-containing protein 3-like n=1 Tax=Alosa alosa TaxID=278164 RepID=UPI0020151BDC|nr:NACHT, LRR and PYD domains-containing protein 3-like [Alosa alosa]
MSDVGDHKEEDSSGEVRFHTGNATQDQSWKRVLQGTGDSVSPTSSDVALNSEHSMGYPINFGTGDRRQQDRPHSPSFTVTSLKSDRSKGFPVNFSADDIQQARPHSPSFTVTSLKSDRSKGFPVNFSADDIQQDRPHSPPFTVTSLKSDRSKGFPVNFSADDTSQEKNEATGCFIKGVPDIQHQSEVTDKMASFQKFHKDCMSRKFKTLSEGPSPHTNPLLLNEIYTELYITEVEREEVNKQHEIRQIEKASRTAAIEDTPISCNDIFKPLPGQHKTIKTVLTVGVAGIGKTVSVHKFILDWAEGKTNEDVQFIFPLPFRELNLLKEKKLSLLDLIEHFFSEMKSLPPVFTSSKHRVMFIFDGLDECRIPLDFQSNPKCSDVTEPVSVDVLLTNLIKGNLLSSALLWITTRPAAANQIPHASTNLVTEIRGFSDPQKEEYVMKKISDEDLAKRTITYLRSSRSLYIMCHIPVFCWITATVLERMLSGTENVEIPRTLTQVYVHFLTIQIGIKNVKYSEKQKGKDTDEEMIFKLGKLAFQQLEKVNLIFYEEDLRECGIDVTEALVYSGVCTQIFREESGLYQGKVFSFVHLSIQEFLAALYVFLSFSNKERTGKNKPDQHQMSQLSALFRASTLHDLHKTAVDLALQSKNGHLDLFLRFLLGLSLKSNQKLLQKLLKNRGASMDKEKTVEYLKSNFLESHSLETNLNLVHCLNELGDTSMVEDIQRSLISGQPPWPDDKPHSFHQCASLVYLLLTAAEGQYEFKYNQIIKTDTCLVKMLPVIKASIKARLGKCLLTANSCKLLAPVLTQCSCLVRDLDLSDNEIGDAGVMTLSEALSNPKSKLESLWLRNCSLTENSCACLASVLSCSSSLRQLDLSGNRIQDAGVELLTDGLRSTHCTLEELRLHNCGLTDESCASLASALRSNPSHLRELHLSGNTLRESGEKLLEALQKNPHNSLESLITGSIEDDSAEAEEITKEVTRIMTITTQVASVSNANDGSDAKMSDVGDHKEEDSSGEVRFHTGNETQDQSWKRVLQGTGDSVSPTSSDVALNSEHSMGYPINFGIGDRRQQDRPHSPTFTVLSLKSDRSKDFPVNFSADDILQEKNEATGCFIKGVPDIQHQLRNCSLTERSCAILASVLSCSSSLRQLDLSGNWIQDDGVELLTDGLRSTHCVLEELRLHNCGLTDESCASLAAALRSNPSHLRELHLSGNTLRESGEKLLEALQKNPHNSLESLILVFYTDRRFPWIPDELRWRACPRYSACVRW